MLRGPDVIHQSRLGALMACGQRSTSRASDGSGITHSSGINTENASAPFLLDQPFARPEPSKCVGTRSGRTMNCQITTASQTATAIIASTRIHGAVGSRGRPRASSIGELVVVIFRTTRAHRRP